jgi:hypothetical protein
VEGSSRIGDTRQPGEGRSLLGLRQRPLHGGLRRLRVRLQGLVGNRPPRSQRVFRVEINGRRFKRVVFPDSLQAREVASRLALFGPDRIYPDLIYERENELWVEFVEGRPLAPTDPIDAALLDRLADLLSVLYLRDPRRVPTERTRFAHRLRTDLGFLRDVGVLGADLQQRLERFGRDAAPKQVWLGFDCVDAIAKNFVREPGGRLRAVDVESLAADQLLGTGVAKARLRWLGDQGGVLLDRLAERGAPDFRPALPFVELCFRAFWLKNAFLEGKRRFVDPGLLAALLGRGAA